MSVLNLATTPKQLSEYADSDYIIFRCECTPLINLNYQLARHITLYCQTCNTEHYRLLADGTWQSEIERQIQNNKAYQRSVQ